MSYYLNLFSVETWQAFRAAGSRVSGFSRNQRTQAQRTIKEDDTFLCYLVGLGRWCGALKIESSLFVDETPLFKPQPDPYVVRFRVAPIVQLEPEYAIPVREEHIWNRLSWTKEVVSGSVGWGAHFQRSLREMPEDDARFLLELLKNQENERRFYELTAKDRRTLNRATVRTAAGEVAVEIPDEDDEPELLQAPADIRESHRIQSLVAEIGAKMGFKLWIPRADRERVKAATKHDIESAFVDALPMNYNDATIRTIEQIDVIWLRSRSIARAFEIEHTTAIYSGLLRMADLVALQPDINIPLHIIAPAERQGSVLEQIRRPVFTLFDKGPFSERCSLITYDDVRELAAKPDLSHLKDSILEDYLTFAE